MRPSVIGRIYSEHPKAKYVFGKFRKTRFGSHPDLFKALNKAEEELRFIQSHLQREYGHWLFMQAYEKIRIRGVVFCYGGQEIVVRNNELGVSTR